jgi:hypothetical protein
MVGYCRVSIALWQSAFLQHKDGRARADLAERWPSEYADGTASSSIESANRWCSGCVDGCATRQQRAGASRDRWRGK